MVFPEDVVREILLKLPSLKSVVRCCCVCKPWRDLIIRDPYFGDELFKRIDHDCADDPFMVFHKDDGNRYYQIRTHSSNVFGRVDFCYDLYGLVGSCNGILCLRQPNGCKSKYNLQLYNPITREHRKLPPSSLPHWFHQGFGFDLSSNDYKVVSIHGQNRAEIYRLSTNCWSEVNLNVGFTIEPDVLTSSCVYVNGCCYWRLSSKGMILTFDFRTDTFGLMSLPVNNLKCYDGLGVQDNSVAVCRFLPGLSDTVIEVWMMEPVVGMEMESEMVPESDYTWSQKFCIHSKDLISCWVHDGKPFQLKGNGEVIPLLFDEGEGGYASTGMFRFDWPRFRSMLFRPSLVSLRSRCFMPASKY